MRGTGHNARESKRMGQRARLGVWEGGLVRAWMPYRAGRMDDISRADGLCGRVVWGTCPSGSACGGRLLAGCVVFVIRVPHFCHLMIGDRQRTGMQVFNSSIAPLSFVPFVAQRCTSPGASQCLGCAHAPLPLVTACNDFRHSHALLCVLLWGFGGDAKGAMATVRRQLPQLCG